MTNPAQQQDATADSTTSSVGPAATYARESGRALDAANDLDSEYVWTDNDPVLTEGWEPRPPPLSGLRELDEYDDRVAQWEAGLMAEATREAELAERPDAELAAYWERPGREDTDDDGFGL